MKALKIIHYPDPLLRQKALPIDDVNAQIAELADTMINLMVQSRGIGLAAPQVGIATRLFVASPTGRAEDALVFINPELSDFQGSGDMEEGCLSLPGVSVKVKRPLSCHVQALDRDGKPFGLEATDMLARIIQHENDHLDGTLIIDRMSTLQRISTRKVLKQLEREYQNV